MTRNTSRVAPLAGSVDRNRSAPMHWIRYRASLPSRGAWIEIRVQGRTPAIAPVAPLAGSVDRNYLHKKGERLHRVAPLAGSVDRNLLDQAVLAAEFDVAPLAGSVDRNYLVLYCHFARTRSLPSRGAWIEMLGLLPFEIAHQVAPLAGSVDRNKTRYKETLEELVAPLAGSVDRNASVWEGVLSDPVAPLAGSVDRNSSACLLVNPSASRSPRGERG